MKTRLFFAAAIMLCVKISFSQSLLWEISGNGLKDTSYLYGTFHVKDARVFQFADSVSINFNKCKAYAGELILDKTPDVSSLITTMRMPADTTLQMLISKGDYLFVKDKAKKKLGMLAGAIDKIRPIYTTVLITQKDMQKDERKDSSAVLDEYFQIQAKKQNKKLIGIETAEEQIKALNRISLREQAEILVKTLKDEGKEDDGIDQMFDLYMSQDLEAFQTFLEEAGMSEMFSKSLLLDRNYVMADRIPVLIKEQSTFIGIGTAHLPGEEGVIQLLIKKGYRVRPVMPTFKGKPLEKYNKDGLAVETEGGWFKYIPRHRESSILFPSNPTVETSEVNDKKHVSVYTLEPKTQNLYSMEFYKKNPDLKANEFFKNTLSDYKKADTKILKKNTYKYQGFPAMEVEIEEGQMRLRIRYVVIYNMVYELTVAGSVESVRNENAEKFFNSLKYTPLL